ncbi:MAG: protein phosphatase 2C domain-containing protein [Thiomargarita sp.]|nr:protein phosphatase 2C domain-containing protein [Thiomargarita sp.]
MKDNQLETKWNRVGASVVGTSHIKKEQPCHDAFQSKILPNGEIIIAVADGAGSASQPEIGSKLAVQTVMDYCVVEKFADNLLNNDDEWRILLQTLFQQARTALEQKAVTEKMELNDYATTLIVVILTEKWTVCGLIGDCIAVTLNKSNELVSLCLPQKGEYVNTTHFLTQSDALEKLDIQIQHHSVQGIAVLSDGLLDLVLKQNKPYSSFFIPLFDFVANIEDEKEAKKQLEVFLESERVNNRTDDDKTLVLAKRNE